MKTVKLIGSQIRIQNISFSLKPQSHNLPQFFQICVKIIV